MNSQLYLQNCLIVYSGEYSLQVRISQKRAISPVIAHLILIAIVAVGGTATTVFAQDTYNILQLSGYPEIELVTVTGFDARDIHLIEAHNGPIEKPSFLATYLNDGLKGKKEVITVYVKNDSTKIVSLDEIRLGGTEYQFSNPLFIVPFGSYAIISKNLPAAVVQSSSAQLKPGQEVTLVFALNHDIKLGHNLQFKLTTGNGFVAISNVKTGDWRTA